MAKNISKEQLRKQDFLVLKQSRDGTVTNVIAPNGLQIGLSDPRFKNSLTTKGPLIAESGLTGSLTMLVDGNPYLVGGANILLTTGSSGEVTIATTITNLAVRRTKQQLPVTSGAAALTDILLGSSSRINTIGYDTDNYIDMYHNQNLLFSGSVADVTSGIRDYYIKPSSAEVIFAFPVIPNDTITSIVISSGSANNAAAGDGLTLSSNVYDINLHANGGIQFTNDSLQLDLKSGGGLAFDTNEVKIDIAGQTYLSTGLDSGNDKILIWDHSVSALKYTTPGLIQSAGATLDIASVSNILNEGSLASGDLLAVADVDASNEVKKITVEDFGDYLAAGTNAGIGSSTGKLTIDLNDLSAVVVVPSEDSLAIIDAGDNASKKESITDFVAAIRGTNTTTGITSTSGVLSIDIDSQTDITTGAHSDDTLLIWDDNVSAIKKITVNNLQTASAAPPGASYVVIQDSSDETVLTKERVLTAGDGLDLTDAGVNSTVTLAVDVTDFIDTSYGLTESSNNIRVDLKSSAGLVFDSGEIKIDYGTASGQAAQGTNQLTIIAGDGLKSGGTVSLGQATPNIQLDIDTADFAGTGLSSSSDNLNLYIAGGDNITITTGSDGHILISGTIPAASIYTAGNGLDLTGQEFSLDLKNGGGLKIVSTELAVEPNDFVGVGLEDDGSDNLRVKSDSTTGGAYVPVQVSASGVSLLVDGTTIEHSTGTVRVKDSGITNAKLANSSVTITPGGGLKDGGSVALGSSVTLNVDVSDFVGTGLKDAGSEVIAIDDSIIATLTGSVFSGHIGVTGSIHSTTTVSGSLLRANYLTGSLTTLRDGSSYLIAGSNIAITTGSSGAVTIAATGIASGDITAVTAGTGLTGGGTSGDVTLNIDDSVVAILTGAQFSGNVGITGSLGVTAGLSGSLTHLSDGSSYLIAGDNVTIVSGSSGAVTISASLPEGEGDITSVAAGVGLSGGGNTGAVSLALDVSELSALGAAAETTDYLVIQDVTDDSTKKVLISNLPGTGNFFSTISVSGQANVVADSASDTLTLAAGSNVTITTTAGTDTITIASADTDTQLTQEQVEDFAGGLVASGGTKTGITVTYDDSNGDMDFVVSDLTVAGDSGSTGMTPGDTLTIAGGTNVTTSISGDTLTINAPDSGDAFKTISVSGQDDVVADAVTDTLTLVGGSNVTITTNATSDTITIASADTDTQLTTEQVQDIVGAMVDDTETGISVTYDDTNGNLEFVVSDTTVAGDSGSTGITPGDTLTIAGGTNVTTAMSGDTLTITAAGGSIAAVSGSTSVSDVSTFNFDNFGLVQDIGSNTVAITGSIGQAEEGTYTDGLFTDFSPNTTVGTAIDRFNEVLKGLAPAAAPSLDDASCADSGASAKLSFGSSQSVSGYTNAIPSGLTPTDNLSVININGTYSSVITSNDVRVACFAGATVINGTLNDDISADSANYVADSFGNGDQGTLKLYVNDNSTEIHSVNLSSFGSGNSLNGASSGFNLSAATAGHFADSSNFDTFQHRQGTYTITAASQRNGWNYARVTHTVGSSTTTTNYVEWVNDSNSNALAQAGSAMDSLSMTGTKNLSGVKYHTGGTAQYRIRVTNAYRNVYSTSNITFSETNCSIPNQSFPSINHAGGEDETKTLHLTGSVTITGDPILNGSISARTTVPHPLKSNLSNAGSQSISGILLYDLSDTSSVVSETFRGESYRLISGSYVNQAAIAAGGNAWNSTTSLTGVDGLLYYNSRLYAPTQGGVSGDFRNTADGGSITNGPSSNVNYSGLSSGTKTFYRKFQNNSGGSKTNFDLTINGSGTIVSHGTAFSSSRVKAFVKLPTTTGGFASGWMDLAAAFSTGQVADGDGCLVGSLDSSLNATNEITFGTQSVGDDEWVVVIIKADASFTGYISSMSVSWS